MYRILLVGSATDSFEEMVKTLQADGNAEIERADSGGDALTWLLANPADLVVAGEQLIDMAGLEFAKKLVVQNPMVNCALVSALADKDFHEASEGLGVIAKLPSDPGAGEAADLLQKLKIIMGLGG